MIRESCQESYTRTTNMVGHNQSVVCGDGFDTAKVEIIESNNLTLNSELAIWLLYNSAPTTPNLLNESVQ